VTGRGDLRRRLELFWSGPVVWDAVLADWTSLGIGGPAGALIEPGSVEEVRMAVAGCRAAGIPWLVLGGGTNLLIGDAGFAGLVLVLGRRFGTIREVGRDAGRLRVEAAAGCSLSRLLSWSRKRGLSGLEFTVGIPGSVGGAVVMNAGAWGSEIKDVLAALAWLAGDRIVEQDRDQLVFSYRRWAGPEQAVVLSATFDLQPEPPAMIEARCREWSAARRHKQPRMASAGSFFRNPPGDFAGRLIETAGLKGTAVGSAMVSEAHANFLINTGGATAAQMLELMRLVQARVRDVHGVWLEPEVKIVGAAGFEGDRDAESGW
jgi:UDP-N-acetylmuramate dehydrogenase